MNQKRKSTITNKHTELGYTGAFFPLERNYQINKYDIMCGRGKRALNNIGNRRFRITCGMHLEKYLNSKTRAEKTARVTQIIEIVRSNGGHFVKQDTATKQWFDIGDIRAADKVGHALRDADKELHRKDAFEKVSTNNLLPVSKKRKADLVLSAPSAKREDNWTQLLDDLDCCLQYPPTATDETLVRSRNQPPPAATTTKNLTSTHADEAAHRLMPPPQMKNAESAGTSSTIRLLQEQQSQGNAITGDTLIDTFTFNLANTRASGDSPLRGIRTAHGREFETRRTKM